VFCHYDNAAGEEFCDAYVYDGARLVQIANWMTESGPLGSCRGVGEARRTAWEFFGALWESDYRRAAYYYAGPLDETRRYPLSDDLGERARDLEAYCSEAGGHCARLRVFETPAGDTERRSDEVLCEASFVGPRGEEASGFVSVRRIGYRYRVIEVPPRLRRGAGASRWRPPPGRTAGSPRRDRISGRAGPPKQVEPGSGGLLQSKSSTMACP
jgi:hypothetical protein